MPPPEGPRKRRRWPWIVLAVVAALVVIGQLTPKPEADTTATPPPPSIAASSSPPSTTPSASTTLPPTTAARPATTVAPRPPARSTTAVSPSSSAAAASSAVVELARVTEVVDGDTIKVTDPALGVVTVRVLGIDTPETVKPKFTVGCFGPEATTYATEALDGQAVTVTLDPGQDETDRYGRTLAYLTLPDGSDYGVEAVRAGFAKNYVYDDRPVAKQPEIAAAEQAAKTAGAGLWGPACNGDTDSEPIPASAAPEPAPARPLLQAPPQDAGAPGGGGGDTYYANCTEVRAAGADPIYRGEPGYASKLDRDGDGVACE